jgi:ribosomal protein S18 acetylase RimI-like enzyme
MSKAPLSHLDFEFVTLNTWRPRERAEMFGWTLLADDGHLGRLNSVWPLAWTGEVSLDEAIAAAEAWMRARNLTPSFKLADGLVAPPELQDALIARGYTPVKPTLVMTRPLPGAPLDAADATISDTPGDAFFAPLRETPDDFEERRGALERMPAPRAYAVIAENGEALSVGASALSGGVAAIFSMRTRQAARGRGLAKRVLASLLTWAVKAGAICACLQVDEDNEAAVALYRRAGFETAYRYRHWRAI